MCGLPVDGLIELYHPLSDGSRSDKPTVQWIIQHRLVRTPAVWIVVAVLLYVECLVFFLELYRYIYIDIAISITFVFVIFDIAACKVGDLIYKFSLLVYKGKCSYAVVFCYSHIICTK